MGAIGMLIKLKLATNKLSNCYLNSYAKKYCWYSLAKLLRVPPKIQRINGYFKGDKSHSDLGLYLPNVP